MSETTIPLSFSKTMRTTFMKILSGLTLAHIRTRSWRTKVGMLLVLAAIISCFATYGALTETPPFGDDPNLVIWLLNIDLVLLLLLVSLIARRIVSVWSGRKRGIAGSHLHVRLVYLFSILVAVPTIIMTVFSAFFFHFGVQAWFSQRVQTAINESSAVAESYLEEHKQVIRADTLAAASDINRHLDKLMLDQEAFTKMIDTQSFVRNLSEIVVLEEGGRVRASSTLALSLAYERPSDYALQIARSGDVALMMSDEQDRVRALVQLESDLFLFVGRLVDPEVLSHLKSAKLAVEDYNNLQSQYSGMQITVTLIFVVVGLLLLLAAIWLGLLLARQLVNPIGDLVNAADRVRSGDLSARVQEEARLEEFEYLARSFNRMTEQIQGQRDELIEANRQIDRRRHLIETVLEGVSSGVIGVDHDGSINLANSSACDLLNKELEMLSGKYITDIIPELTSLLSSVATRRKKMTQDQISITSGSGIKRTFLFRISIERLDENMTGLIITFDDITELQSAQRKAAWSDVARRIAHEIKNPLTPIQLSAERLQRKFQKESSNEEAFEQCTDTILKHVGDIGRMVDEFSAFARMPEAVLKPENFAKAMREAYLLSKQACSFVTFNFTSEIDENTTVNIDMHQLRQVMNNIMQNAIDALHEYEAQDPTINVAITARKDEVHVLVCDNGPGFPDHEDISKLTEPYITHKVKGTGLGLAIVKKIMEDHGGEITLGAPDWLETKQNSGACVVLTWPMSPDIISDKKKDET